MTNVLKKFLITKSINGSYDLIGYFYSDKDELCTKCIQEFPIGNINIIIDKDKTILHHPKMDSLYCTDQNVGTFLCLAILYSVEQIRSSIILRIPKTDLVKFDFVAKQIGFQFIKQITKDAQEELEDDVCYELNISKFSKVIDIISNYIWYRDDPITISVIFYVFHIILERLKVSSLRFDNYLYIFDAWKSYVLYDLKQNKALWYHGLIGLEVEKFKKEHEIYKLIQK